MVKAIKKIKTDTNTPVSAQSFVQQVKTVPNSQSKLTRKILLNCTEEESDMINTLMSDGEVFERYTQTNVLRAGIRALLMMPEEERMQLIDQVTVSSPKAGRRR
ncbi:hypothetical protein O3K13_06755 [Yersinia pestis]|nr:hypothetical protein [Salmonella enterica subsp. enterica serovar Abony]EEP7800057.1 hypothetical protein [Salmonella enterica]MDL0603689.1 hypothetical protein [Yersinia pestis]